VFNQKICKSENAASSLINRANLESAVGSAFFFLEETGFAHGSIPEIAATLCYKIAKNHPFLDGNKRTAAAAAIVLLNMNDWDIEYEEYGDADTEFSREIFSFVENKTDLDDLKKWFLKKTIKK
jgi:death-on-curing family protein